MFSMNGFHCASTHTNTASNPLGGPPAVDPDEHPQPVNKSEEAA